MRRKSDDFDEGQLEEDFRYKLLNERIEDLQERMSNEINPWYQFSNVVAAFALFVSLGLALVTFSREDKIELQEDRAALRSVLARLVVVPREEWEMYSRFKNENFVGEVAVSVNSETSLLVSQALDLMERIGETVSANERVSLAGPLFELGRNYEAKEQYRLAAQDKDAQTHDIVGAYRGLAIHAFLDGDFESGRKNYKKALEISSKNASKDGQRISDNFNAMTNLWWAQAEAGARHCDEARVRLNEVEFLFKSNPSTFNQAFPQMLDGARQTVSGCR